MIRIRNNIGIKDEICTCYSATILWCATLCRKQLSDAPLTLQRFYSDEPGQQSGEMDTLQIHLFGNQKISIILVATNLLHLLQIRKNGQSTVQNFASEIDIKKIKFSSFVYYLFTMILSCFFVDISDFVKSVLS